MASQLVETPCDQDVSGGHVKEADPVGGAPKQDTTLEDEHATPPYSVLTTRQKWCIIAIAAWAGWFSSASSFIYFPAIPFLARDTHTSVQEINLTVTSYLITAGLFPTVTGSIADVYGRRITLVVSLAVYAAVNIGLATQRSFGALFGLRMLQSAAISAGFSITYGLIGDLTTPAERGGFAGILSIFLNTPASVAPMISGLLLIRWPWPSIFWFLTVVSLTVLLVTMLFLPETCRAIVGNGSIMPPRWDRPLMSTLCPENNQASTSSGEQQRKGQNVKHVLHPRSLIAPFRDRATLALFFSYGIYYMVHSCLQASLSTIFVDVYHVSGLVAGLVYIPFGVACMLASFLAGKILDRDYRITAKAQGLNIDRRGGDDMATYPVEHARLRTSRFSAAICFVLIAAYGWTLQFQVNMAVPLVFQFFIGMTNQIMYTSLNTLLVDYYPDRSASAQAANNLVRCELSAAGLAALDTMINVLGVGWCFVVFAVLYGITLPILITLERRGVAWRSPRAT